MNEGSLVLQNNQSAANAAYTNLMFNQGKYIQGYPQRMRL